MCTPNVVHLPILLAVTACMVALCLTGPVGTGDEVEQIMNNPDSSLDETQIFAPKDEKALPGEMAIGNGKNVEEDDDDDDDDDDDEEPWQPERPERVKPPIRIFLKSWALGDPLTTIVYIGDKSKKIVGDTLTDVMKKSQTWFQSIAAGDYWWTTKIR